MQHLQILSFTSAAVPDLILMKIWSFFSTKPSAPPAHPAIENGCLKPAALSKFSVSTPQAFLLRMADLVFISRLVLVAILGRQDNRTVHAI